MRRLITLVLLATFMSASLLQSVGGAAPPAVPDHLRAFSIVPPGQEGNVTADELLMMDFGPHYEDQLEPYAALIEDDDVTEEELSKYFHSMQFGPGADIESEYSPIDGVTVYRDSMGIPHIYADTLTNASYALGYVTAEDRMFEMDAFRHAARGTLAEFVGPGEDDANLKMDIATRREGYTDAEVQKMYDDLDDKFGDVGKTVQEGLQAYVDGINAKIAEIRMNPPECDAAYQATGNACPPNPDDWEILDTLHLVVLQLRVFGETAGGELEQAGLYSHLKKDLGKKLGVKVYNDLARQNDPRSATSIPASEGRFPSQNIGPVNKASFAIPDNAESLAQRQAAARELRLDVLRSIGFPTGPTSNALIVSGAESRSGNPLQIGAPQVGYAVPAFFMDIDVHAPGVDFRGPAVPGASALIPLGRGADYAWSLTTGYSDAVDTRVELLCDPGGGEAQNDSNGYMFKGECREMESREETFVVTPTPVDPGPPREETHTFYRTKHGPVFARGKVKGKPVAFVKQRFFWKKEIDSVPQFYLWNTGIEDVEDFVAAARDFTMSFNSFYVDSNDIGYFHVGLYPKRARGVHPSLPTWGTGKWEWRGRLPFDMHPQVIDPAQGWIANWNNQPARSWKNFDGLKFGAVHRVELLQDQMRRLLAGEKTAQLSDLVDVIRVAATQDTRGLYLGPRMVTVTQDALAGGDAKDAEALEAVAKWVSDGAHRKNLDRDENMDDGAALVLFDEWYKTLVRRIFDDEIGADDYDLVPAPITDYVPDQGSNFWFDFSSYLENLFKASSRKAYARNYCDDMTTGKAESCNTQIVRAFTAALAQVREEQGADMSAWATPAENIVFSEFGAGSVDPIPWQNRGTHNHVVEVLSDAGR
ncbi:MAG TPA: penicillin acylase family protein [Actinomycetota bacterium]|nr:penicillin acylase family protein [Actinomycetota bacterium]